MCFIEASRSPCLTQALLLCFIFLSLSRVSSAWLKSGSTRFSWRPAFLAFSTASSSKGISSTLVMKTSCSRSFLACIFLEISTASRACSRAGEGASTSATLPSLKMVFSIIGDLHSSRAAIFPCLGPPGLCNLNCEGGVDDGGRLEGPVGIGEGGGEGERPCETDLGGGVSPRPPRPRTTPGTDAVVDPVDARSLGSRNPLVLGDFRTDAKPVEIGPDMGTMLAAP
mmetsp:Transcript_8933/g.19852  ORF Transcript_8933/g.19852 Transcript_8933/m.19852 type:complete len:226 (-) Transcript_8933:1218-1895(-)